MRVTPFSTETVRKTMPNQFEVAIVSAKRTKELNRGATPMVSIDENTPTNRSIALKEIAEGKVGIDYLTK